MTDVRCPACQHIEPDPPEDYRCSSCGQKLRRSDTAGFAIAMQLGLFGESVPVEQSLPRRGPRRPGAGLDPGGHFQSRRQSEQDAVAVITDFFHHVEDEPAETFARVFAMLAGKATGDLRETAFAAAWFATNCLHALEDAAPGWGTELLQLFALKAAQDTPE